MEPKFINTTIETQRDFLEVNYKITFMKSVIWLLAEITGGIGCMIAASQGIGKNLMLCGIALLIMGVCGLIWPAIRSKLGYRKALQIYGGAMQPSTVTFGSEIIDDTPNGVITMPYNTVRTIHFLTDSFVIEDNRGVGVIVSKNGFGDVDYMDCINFLCEQCSNLKL